jgi:ABC-2 type transport system ATP-binding protein
MELFEAANIFKSYGNYTALDNVSISVPEGTIYGLLGPNGAGKTTLIRIINQIFAPDKGELFFNGRKMQANDVFNIGYLPEERGLYKKMKVGEQAIYLARLKGLSKHDAVKKLKYWFEKFEMLTWWDKKIEDLSKGMAQKVQFIVTILHDPKLLIFDEPFSGFDPINATLLRDEILDMKSKGATIIFSTHNMSSVEELCDHITLINKSKCILQGDVDEIKNRFKSDVYEISFKGDYERVKNILNSKFEIQEHKKVKDFDYVRVKMLQHKVDNELLSMVLPHAYINSFNEIYPSMNEIFIKVVESSNNQN